MKYTFVMTDIHGCKDQFLALLELVQKYREMYGVSREDAKFVFMGDYVDRGPDSKGVVDIIMGLPYEMVTLMGNHEDMMMNSVSKRVWLANGGYSTLDSYGVDYFDGFPAEHKEFYHNLELYHEDEHRFYVHAGVYPDSVPANNSKNVMLWVREEFIHSKYDWGKLIVHGHTPTGVEIKPNRINLDSAGVFGHTLSCGVFNESKREPVDILSVPGLQRREGPYNQV